MKINNKCREVLENILTNFPGGLGQYPEIYKQVIDVLKEPLKNGDIGTAEEQQARHYMWCRKHGIVKYGEVNCLHQDMSCSLCALRWSQMPYVKEEN